MDYKQIAERYINDKAIYIYETPKFRVVELEIYHNDDDHPDPYCHCHPEQKEFKSWYFHKASLKPNSKYRGGSFKGVDYTLGNPTRFFGMLIRSIQDIVTKNVTEGPCKVVEKLLSETHSTDIPELVEKIQSSNILTMRECDIEPYTISHGARIGLNKDKSSEYVGKKYRFAVKELVKKQRKDLEEVE